MYVCRSICARVGLSLVYVCRNVRENRGLSLVYVYDVRVQGYLWCISVDMLVHRVVSGV